MKIAIDAGHGRSTPGKRCLKSIDPKETREWVLNSRIAEKVIQKLKDYDCATLRMDDPTGKVDVSLRARTEKANRAECDFYVSIHHNAGIQGGSGGGIVVYSFLGAKSSTKAVAKAVYDATVAQTGLRGNRSAGVAEANFHVLRETRMSAILGEFGFMDSIQDTPIILTESFAEQCATGIVEGLAKGLGLNPRAKEESMVTEKETEDKDMKYEKMEEVPHWARAIVEKMVERGIHGGDGKGLDLTDGEISALVYLDRGLKYIAEHGKW